MTRSSERASVILTAFLVPPLILCAVLALGRYEEFLLDPDVEPAPAAERASGRHLRALPDIETPEAGPGRKPRPGHRKRPGRRHAA
nr:hypothetical protein OG409_36050 [Streptomyces sp. NBC_00974]